MYIDLHVHTDKSDGKLSPRDLIDKAIEKGLSGLAITDHDNIKAYGEVIGYAMEKEFLLIPGVELSAVEDDEEVHILGYFFDVEDVELLDMLTCIQKNRYMRGIKIIDKLNSMKIPISLDEVYKYSQGGYIGRPHIAKVLVDKGYVESMQEAFSVYLNYGKAAYVVKEGPNLEETIDLIHRAKGKAVLAHPKLIKNQQLIDKVIGLGIDGIEVVHSKHKDADTNKYLNLVRKYKLFATGGSDCHGELYEKGLLLGNYTYDDLDWIKELI